MGSFLSLLELAFSLCSPLCNSDRRRGAKRENLVENEITSHEGVHWCRISRIFLTACATVDTFKLVCKLIDVLEPACPPPLFYYIYLYIYLFYFVGGPSQTLISS